MISLIKLLSEGSKKPKAIFMAGPAGSGKTFIRKKIIPSNFITLNIDDEYEELLKKSGLGLKQQDFDSEKLSQAAKMMSQAQKSTREKFSELSKQLKDIVIDGTGAASRPLLKKKDELEALGYDTFMVLINVSPITSLKRNTTRDRQLLPSIIIKTWHGVNTNIDTYKEAFGEDHFALINNDPEDAELGFEEEDVRIYINKSKAKGKPKTPEQLAKRKAEKEKINIDIKQMVQIERKFDTLEQAKQKIDRFLNE